jgi:predicted site-specific integrase-resolvase
MNQHTSLSSHTYKTPKLFKQCYGVTSATLIRWEKKGCVRTLHNKFSDRRIYSQEDVARCVGDHGPEATQAAARQTILYARVSSAKQRPDLEKQIQDLQDIHAARYNKPTAFEKAQETSRQKEVDQRVQVIQDIGSGVKFKRKGLLTLLEQVHKGDVCAVAVMQKDRLARIGREVLEWFFEKHNTKLLVYGEAQDTTHSDLAEDLLAITTVLVASHNGKRSAANKQRRRRSQEGEEGRKERGTAATENEDLQNPCSQTQACRKRRRIQKTQTPLAPDHQDVVESGSHYMECSGGVCA